MFEDLGRSLRKVVDPLDGSIKREKLGKIEHFWVFDGRLTPAKKDDMIKKLIENIKGEKEFFEVFRAKALEGLKKESVLKVKASQLEAVLNAMIKTNI
ncbi:hypothetical protein [Marinagarivorans algicola]|uniref:hypothetical protein n=1 Tax=Marinagarivorans algicola TaxID=1513270 RepID=UPI0012E23400|nr:hypothetical protein [Marinagarivorans algicola]